MSEKKIFLANLIQSPSSKKGPAVALQMVQPRPLQNNLNRYLFVSIEQK